LENITWDCGTNMINLKWHGDLPNDLSEIEQKVKEDLITLHEDLDGECGELIFHHVFLSKDYNDPLVFVWGELGDNECYHCEYIPNPKWESIKNSVDSSEENC